MWQEASTIKACVSPLDPRVLASPVFEVPIERTYFFMVPRMPPVSLSTSAVKKTIEDSVSTNHPLRGSLLYTLSFYEFIVSYVDFYEFIVYYTDFFFQQEQKTWYRTC